MEITPISSSSRTLKVRASKSSEPSTRKTPKAVVVKRKAKTIVKPIAEESAAPIDMSQMIATAAYFIAQRRNFAPGNEISDWLMAEQQVKGLHSPS